MTAAGWLLLGGAIWIPPVRVSAQSSDELLARFTGTLQVGFIGPLRAAHLELTPERRARCIAYILRRELNDLRNYEADRQAGQRLQETVRQFVLEMGTPGEWEAVERILQRVYDPELERVLGGPPKIEPIVESLERLAEQRRTLVYSISPFETPENRRPIMTAAQEFLGAIRRQRFEEVRPLVTGKLAEEWKAILAAMAEQPDRRREMAAFAERLEWKLDTGEVTATTPPVARLRFGVMDVDRWTEYEMFLILDAGRWRVFRFDEQKGRTP